MVAAIVLSLCFGMGLFLGMDPYTQDSEDDGPENNDDGPLFYWAAGDGDGDGD
jgi:hypothetical protein